jgi:ABC-2 type transport system permease protein
MTGLSVGRIYAVVLRNLYVMRRSWPRLLELTYWPALQVLIWGFTSRYFMSGGSTLVVAASTLVAAVLLWDVMMRSQLGVSVSCMEELWSRNLGHLFISPLKPIEWLLALMAMSVFRTIIGVAPAILVGWFAYQTSLFDLGLPLVAFFACLLIMGWALGLLAAALLLRYGLGAETFAWVAPFALAPVSAVYYPVATLPAALQPIALSLPSSYVFEGMRAVLTEHVFHWDLFIRALALDGFYITIAGAIFLYAFQRARVLGRLVQVGE